MPKHNYTSRDFERPEVHEKALEQRVPLGTIRTGTEIGLAGNTKYVWQACPACDKRRWTRLRDKQRGDPLWCRSCAAKRRARYLPMLKAREKGAEKRAAMWALGKACYEAGVTLEEIAALQKQKEAVPQCPGCADTGTLETGNNDLPCDCPAGDTAMFNVSGYDHLLTGAEVRQTFNEPWGSYWRARGGKAE